MNLFILIVKFIFIFLLIVIIVKFWNYSDVILELFEISFYFKDLIFIIDFSS